MSWYIDLQLSQEIDQASSKASSSSSIQSTSLWTTSSTSCAQSKSEIPVSSYPTFHITHESKLPCHEYFQVIRKLVIVHNHLCFLFLITSALYYIQNFCMINFSYLSTIKWLIIQKNSRAPRQKMKNPDNGKQQKTGKDNMVEKDCFNGKKKKSSPCWPRMKLLGC